MKRMLAVIILTGFGVGALLGSFSARRWTARWGTPIDKGNHPAKIPIGAKTQARFSSEYEKVRAYEL